jgi:Dyp-type peroxidase family
VPEYRVLALDGGGVRGLMTAMLLERLCRQPGLEHAFDRIDLIAGNSSGALIALALAHGLNHPTMLETLGHTRIAFEHARDVFGPGRVPIPVLNWLMWVFLTKYRNQAREKAVKDLLGPQTRLRDLKTHVLITSFDLENEGGASGRKRVVDRMWKPKIFHNFIGPNSDREIFAWQAALYSTSAVTYFPSADGFVDGGIYANNPSMCALAQIYDKRYSPKPKPPLDDVLLFSVGAGQNLFSVPGSNVSWGLGQWAWKGRFVSLTMDATVGVADYECRQLLSDSNYKRLNPDFGGHEAIALDDFASLEDIAQRLESPEVEAQIKETADWLREYWMAGMTTGPILPEPTSKHVGTATELTCLMPIKPGFVPVLDTRTYATRLRAVFKVLQTLRAVSREQRELKPVLDIVEAARTVHSFSWAIVQERYLLLQVVFDRPWEPYIRVVWQDLGPLLDLFICNCEGFVPSSDGFAAFSDFVRRHQVEANFFYPSSSTLTVDDEDYLVQLEKLQRQQPGKKGDEHAATFVATGPIARARKDSHDDPAEAARQWLAVLDVLYGLRMFYPAGSPDHVYLQRGTRALLAASRPERELPPSAALDWFESAKADVGAAPVERRKLAPDEVQGGIQKPYRNISHGSLILARVDDEKKAREFIGAIAGRVTSGGGHPDRGADAEPGSIYTNVAFTFSGLKRLGVQGSILARFPKEFREGMEARAGLLGDVRQNHPENWTLPAWDPHRRKGDSSGTRLSIPIRTSTVDVVITLNQVRARDEESRGASTNRWDSVVQDLYRTLQTQGLQVLAVEPLRRLRPNESSGGQRLTRDHFGFLDGISQPNASDDPQHFDDVELGEIFVGFQNLRGDPPFPATSTDASAWVRGSLIDSGSFLVVRKLRQYRQALDTVLGKEKEHGNDPERLLSKMVGRSRDGEPLATIGNPDRPNEFDFGNDSGAVCPFHAHIRRGNPRLPRGNPDGTQSFIPRIARRSLAYGPDFDGSDHHDRGVMFMAYNASIAEQFEIVQRWMSGGNAPGTDGNSGIYSGQPDPLLGLPDVDGKRVYRFVDDDHKVRHVDLGTPFVTLQWGLYLFVPSLEALKTLSQPPAVDVDMGLAAISQGEQLIRKLTTSDEWAAALEDASANQGGATSAIFYAIRKAHNGVLRTPYGVLVGSHDLAMQVLSSDPVFSVSEYQRRFAASVGESYLGVDRGRVYEKLSTRPNEIVELFSESKAFNHAYELTTATLAQAIDGTVALANTIPGRPTEQWLPLPLEPVADFVLGMLAQRWFDIPDGKLIKLGGRPAQDSDDVHCPFSFLAPSRYVFSSPNPRDTVSTLGQGDGQRLLDQARLFVRRCRERQKETGDAGLHGEISIALFQAIDHDDDLLARTLLGLVFGFVPTVYGNALTILGSWINDETLWRVQQRLLSAEESDRHGAAASIMRDEIARVMLARPVPPLLHRTVTSPTELGGVELRRGDRVVVSMWGVTQDISERGVLDIMPIFGGDRKAAGHPLHACPGYGMAMGVLLGMLTAVVELHPIAPGPALTTIRVPNPSFL